MKKEKDTLEEFIRRNSHYGMGSIGAEYWSTRDKDIKEIAKIVKVDLTKTMKGWSKGVKISVKISRFAGGESLRAVVTVPKTYKGDLVRIRYITEETMDKYNYNFSNGQYDYFNVRFYSRSEVKKK